MSQECKCLTGHGGGGRLPMDDCPVCNPPPAEGDDMHHKGGDANEPRPSNGRRADVAEPRSAEPPPGDERWRLCTCKTYGVGDVIDSDPDCPVCAPGPSDGQDSTLRAISSKLPDTQPGGSVVERLAWTENYCRTMLRKDDEKACRDAIVEIEWLERMDNLQHKALVKRGTLACRYRKALERIQTKTRGLGANASIHGVPVVTLADEVHEIATKALEEK